MPLLQKETIVSRNFSIQPLAKFQSSRLVKLIYLAQLPGKLRIV